MASLIYACTTGRTDDDEYDVKKMAKRERKKQKHMSTTSTDDPKELVNGTAMDIHGEHNNSSLSGLRSTSIQDRPLTRYLPLSLSSHKFDLLQHLENIWGQALPLPASPRHLTITSSRAQGPLFKHCTQTPPLPTTWNRRWFVFDVPTRSLFYTTRSGSEKSVLSSSSRRVIPFHDICDVHADHEDEARSPAPSRTFCLQTRTRSYYLLAPSVESMRVWIDVMFSGAEAYRSIWEREIN